MKSLKNIIENLEKTKFVISEGEKLSVTKFKGPEKGEVTKFSIRFDRSEPTKIIKIEFIWQGGIYTVEQTYTPEQKVSGHWWVKEYRSSDFKDLKNVLRSVTVEDFITTKTYFEGLLANFLIMENRLKDNDPSEAKVFYKEFYDYAKSMGLEYFEIISPGL